MRKEQRRLGELELKDTRRCIGVADQIHARIQRRGKRYGAERPFAGAQLIKLRHARGNFLGREELAGRTFPAAQQGSLADGMAERAAEIDERGLAIGVDSIEIRLQHDAAILIEEALDVLDGSGKFTPPVALGIARA